MRLRVQFTNGRDDIVIEDVKRVGVTAGVLTCEVVAGGEVVRRDGFPLWNVHHFWEEH